MLSVADDARFWAEEIATVWRYMKITQGGFLRAGVNVLGASSQAEWQV